MSKVVLTRCEVEAILYLLHDYKTLIISLNKERKKVLRKGFNSAYALDNCYNLIDIKISENLLKLLKNAVLKVLQNFNKYDILCIQYKFCGKKEIAKQIDVTSRYYFRHQQYLMTKLGKLFCNVGIDRDFIELLKSKTIYKKYLDIAIEYSKKYNKRK